MAASGCSLILVARSAADLEAEARHLRTTFGVEVHWIVADASSPQGTVDALRPLAGGGQQVRNLLFPVGMADDVDDGQLAAARVAALVNANLASIMAVVALFLPDLLGAGEGNIIGFGSVAAIRGRGANVIYAAAKRGLESYFESIRHLTAGTGVCVQFYRLGYVDTQIAWGRRMYFPITTPEKVAEHVQRNLNRDLGNVHYPLFWWGVGLLLRGMPWFVYRRLRF
jgi:short-subunit dehydrogenase